MSCPNATAPIDISISKIKGKCDLKCAYSFRYSNSSCVATNRGNYVSIAYDKSSTSPVVYNSTGFDVQEIRLYTPSLHSYSGTKTDAELIIIHSSPSGSNPLLVCIPIRSNNSTSVSSLLFQKIIDTMISSAPSNGETTTVNVSRFNLSTIVPKKPFFSYSATEPYQPCSASVDYIVYSSNEVSLDISADTLSKLKKIIKSNPYDVKKGQNLFYNEKGPGKGNSVGDDIYIDCQPVNSSKETVDVITDLGTNVNYNKSIKELLNNNIVKMLLGSFLFIIILFLVKYGLNMIKPGKGYNLFDNSVKTR